MSLSASPLRLADRVRKNNRHLVFVVRKEYVTARPGLGALLNSFRSPVGWVVMRERLTDNPKHDQAFCFLPARPPPDHGAPRPRMSDALWEGHAGEAPKETKINVKQVGINTCYLS